MLDTMYVCMNVNVQCGLSMCWYVTSMMLLVFCAGMHQQLTYAPCSIFALCQTHLIQVGNILVQVIEATCHGEH